jgi:thiol-disulfide isomerase/thioredoxin
MSAVRRFLSRTPAWLLAFALLAWSARSRADAVEDLLGRLAAPWHAAHWLNSAPLELAALRGRVVLVRLWTAPDCPFCEASAPALNDFHARYAQRGLTVIGLSGTCIRAGSTCAATALTKSSRR